MDELEHVSRFIEVEYKGEFLTVSVDPELRERALRFMNSLIIMLNVNVHNMIFYIGRCQFDIYGQLTEKQLR